MVKTIVGLYLNDILFSLAFFAIQRSRIKLVFFERYFFDKEYSGNNLLTILYSEQQSIYDRIKEISQKYFFSIEGVFLNWPLKEAKVKSAQEIISLDPYKRKKRVSCKDNQVIKRHLEESALEWDETLLHHLVNYYILDQEKTENFPLGKEGRKLGCVSQLISLPNNTYEEVIEFFNNLGLPFLGCVCQPLSAYALVYQKTIWDELILLDLNWKSSEIYFFRKRIMEKYHSIDIGEQDIICKVGEKFSISLALARQVVTRYGSFFSGNPDKEIRVKEGENYYNISIVSLSQFLKEKFTYYWQCIYPVISSMTGEENFPLSMTTELINIEGLPEEFRQLHRGYLVSVYNCPFSLACGTAIYGTNRFMEKNIEKIPWWQRIYNTCREYF